MNTSSLSNALSDTLKDKTLSCVGDLVEVGIDGVLDDNLLKEIPFISTAISVYRIGRSIAERHYIKKLAVFLESIASGIADDKTRQQHIDKINQSNESRDKELEYLLVLIDRYVSADKPVLLGKLYLAFLDGKIIWEELTMYAEVVDRFLYLDCRTLLSCDGKITVHRNIGGESVLRLVALGLMTETNESSIFEQRNGGLGITAASMERATSNDKTYRRTEFGDKLSEILKQ